MKKSVRIGTQAFIEPFSKAPTNTPSIQAALAIVSSISDVFLYSPVRCEIQGPNIQLIPPMPASIP